MKSKTSSKKQGVQGRFTLPPKSFCQNVKGNVSMIFALSSLTLIIGVGAAIDYTQMTADVQKAQDVVDGAVLAAAHEYYQSFTKNDSGQAANVASRLHLASESATGEHKVETEFSDSSNGSITIKSSISGTTRHKFMGIVGNPEKKWTVEAYSEVSIPEIEILLVVDASASMNGQKITTLKSSLTQFVEDIAPYRVGESRVVVSMIPYAESINFGQDADVWLHQNQDVADFNGCFRFNENDRPGNMTDPKFNQRVNGFPICPPQASEALLFSTDADELTKRVAGLQLGWGTDSGLGLIWAERFLDNSWRTSAAQFSENTPASVSAETQKVVILLTDGAIAITDANDDGRKDGRRAIRRNSNIAIGDFADQCNSLGQIPNLDLFTVAYSVNNAGFRNTLQNCVSGGGEYYNANVGNLDAIFKQISDRLTPIRISG